MPDRPIDVRRRILRNPEDGSFSTEETITVDDGTRHYNIPTIVGGMRLSPEMAILAWRGGDNPEVGDYATRAEAEAAARKRSDDIGRLRANAARSGEIGEIPRSTGARIIGDVGSGIRWLQDWARERVSWSPRGALAQVLPESPVDLLGDPGGALEDWSYGFGPVRMAEGTQGAAGRVAGMKADPRLLDVAQIVPGGAVARAGLRVPYKALDRAIPPDLLAGTVMAPDQLAFSTALKEGGKRAARNTKKTANAAIDWKAMAPLERQEFALRGGHLKQMPDGKYVGSPNVYTPAELGKLRALLAERVRETLEHDWTTGYPPWYERQRAGVLEVAGNNPAKQHMVAQGIGIYSPQATPDVNFTAMANQSAHHMYTGDPTRRPRTKPQSEKYAKVLQGQEVKQGPKTGPFAESSDPSRADPHMATNDIWVGRLFGYAGKDGKEFSRGFTPQEHAFVQGELQRVTSIANKEGWGGKTTWTVEEIQANPWVHLKGQSLAKKEKLTYEKGIEKAQRTTLEALPRNTAYLNNEVIPGAASRHLEGVRLGSDDLKDEYTRALGNFIGADQRNVFTQSLPNALERPAVPFVGDYVSDGVRTSDPGIASRPIVERIKSILRDDAGAPVLSKKGNPIEQVDIDPTSMHALKVQQALHGLFNMQEGSPINMFVPQGPGVRVADMNAAMVGQVGSPLTKAQVGALREASTKAGLPHIVDFGDGRAIVTNFDKDVALIDKARKALHNEIPDIKTVYGKRISDMVDLKAELKQPEGSGAVTQAILDLLDESPEQSRYLLQRYDKNPDVFEHIAGGGARDATFATRTNTAARGDLDHLRDEVLKRNSLEAFFDWVRKNGTAGFPAVGAIPLASQYGDPDSALRALGTATEPPAQAEQDGREQAGPMELAVERGPGGIAMINVMAGPNIVAKFVVERGEDGRVSKINLVRE